jgi:hypothetical protein
VDFIHVKRVEQLKPKVFVVANRSGFQVESRACVTTHLSAGRRISLDLTFHKQNIKDKNKSGRVKSSEVESFFFFYLEGLGQRWPTEYISRAKFNL